MTGAARDVDDASPVKVVDAARLVAGADPHGSARGQRDRVRRATADRHEGIVVVVVIGGGGRRPDERDADGKRDAGGEAAALAPVAAAPAVDGGVAHGGGVTAAAADVGHAPCITVTIKNTWTILKIYQFCQTT